MASRKQKPFSVETADFQQDQPTDLPERTCEATVDQIIAFLQANRGHFQQSSLVSLLKLPTPPVVHAPGGSKDFKASITFSYTDGYLLIGLPFQMTDIPRLTVNEKDVLGD